MCWFCWMLWASAVSRGCFKVTLLLGRFKSLTSRRGPVLVPFALNFSHCQNATEAERERARATVCPDAVAASKFTAQRPHSHSVWEKNDLSALCSEKWGSGEFHVAHEVPQREK